MAIWYILWSFGIFLPVLVFCTNKIWQPWSEQSRRRPYFKLIDLPTQFYVLMVIRVARWSAYQQKILICASLEGLSSGIFRYNLWPLGMPHDPLVYFMALWYMYFVAIWYTYFSRIGMFYQEESGNPGWHR
jgi:hypothetical protein